MHSRHLIPVLGLLSLGLLLAACPFVRVTDNEGVTEAEIADCCSCLAANTSDDEIECLETTDEDGCNAALGSNEGVDISGQSCLANDCDAECSFLSTGESA